MALPEDAAPERTAAPDAAAAPEAVVPPEPAVAPERAAAREFRVHPLVPRLWFWQSLVFPLGLGVVCAAVLVLRGRGALGALALAGGFVAAWAATWHARTAAKRLRLHLLPDGLLVLRGVWWRQEIFIPRARVQHTDVAQGPIGRRLGIATLKVFTAASHAGVIEVEGLDRADAVEVRDRLLGRGDPDAL